VFFDYTFSGQLNDMREFISGFAPGFTGTTEITLIQPINGSLS
jgi:hypothetical protein